MTGFLDELQAAVGAAPNASGRRSSASGRGWGRGSGVVIAPGRVLTNAHVLRGEEVAVRSAAARSRTAASPAPTPTSTSP